MKKLLSSNAALYLLITAAFLFACSKATHSQTKEQADKPEDNRIASIKTTLPADSCNNYFFSVNTCPGENSSTQMNASWGVKENTDYCIVYLIKNQEIINRIKLEAGKASRCHVFDGIYSKRANGENFYENARFLKYGYTFSQLSPGTRYSYIITSYWKDSQGVEKSARSALYNFTTAPKGNWNACVISDFHSYPPIPGRLTAAMGMVGTVSSYSKQLIGRDIDWVLHLGDVVAWGGSWSFWNIMYRQGAFKNYMWAGLNGNHDNMTREYGESNLFFKCSTANPSNGYDGQKGVCYYFTYGDVLFVMLNSEVMKNDAGLEAAQTWVKKVLSQSSAKFKVVCEHYQWFYGSTGKTSQYDRWKELFDSYGVDLALGANNHIYVRTHKLYADKVSDGKKGTVYLQTPSSDNDRGQDPIGELEHNQELIASRWNEGPHTVGALLLEAAPNSLTLTLLDRNGILKDKVVISK